MIEVFIDGKEGTTGLRIFERLSTRDDIHIISLKESMRKDAQSRRRALNSCDIAFLCLPDTAAIEAVSMIENENVRVIDASTAHRTNPEWTYGFPEIFDGGAEKIKRSKRVAVPGCHASGFIALIKPLIDSGIINSSENLFCHSVTGYSGGGKAMISQYEDAQKSELLCAPRQYGLSQNHKHLKEMTAICTLESPPCFSPVVADFYSGMCVTVPIFKSQLKNADINTIKDVYKQKYSSGLVSFKSEIGEDGFISACAMSKRDDMEIFVSGNDERILLIARYDNLGKGASGAAMQCMNLMIDCDEKKGLNVNE